MTFPDTLRELARLRPEKFPEMKYWFDYQSHHIRIERRLYNPALFTNFLESFTQDKIDTKLADIGWEYQLFPRVKEGKATEWGFIVWELGKAPLRVTGEWFSDKGKAAQAAVTAVVEELAKEKL